MMQQQRFSKFGYARFVLHNFTSNLPPQIGAHIQVIQKVEAEQWRRTTALYDPLAVHMTVPLILYENQHLDSRLKTLAVSGGRPKFSASGLGKQGRRAPFELKLPKADEETGAKQVPAWRSDVQLPLRDSPWNIPKSGPQETPSLEGAERSHFWLYVVSCDGQLLIICSRFPLKGLTGLWM